MFNPKHETLDAQNWDNISVISVAGPAPRRSSNATTIKIPYQATAPRAGAGAQQEDMARIGPSERLEPLDSNIKRLRARLDNISAPGKPVPLEREPDRFDYRTLVANLNAAPVADPSPIQRNHSIDVSYNARPLHQGHALPSCVTQLPDCVAQLELTSASSGFGSEGERASLPNGGEKKQAPAACNYIMAQFINSSMGANDESKASSLGKSYVHLSAARASRSDRSELLDDVASVHSSSNCSLKSSRTYNISAAAHQPNVDHEEATRELDSSSRAADARDGEADFEQRAAAPANDATDDGEQLAREIGADPLSVGGAQHLSPAWIFDPSDGSSRIIEPPAKPKRPDLPEIQTEELAVSRGGRSYYLGLVESQAADKRTSGRRSERADRSANIVDTTDQQHTRNNNRSFQRSGVPIRQTANAIGSMDSLYSRWNSMKTLNSISSSISKQAQRTPPITSNGAKCSCASTLDRQLSSANSTSRLDSLQQHQPTATESRRPTRSASRSERQIRPARLLANEPAADDDNNEKKRTALLSQPTFNHAQVSVPFGLRSKSSSSLNQTPLASSTKPTKYSIYGGFRSRDGSYEKSVPRLSYSRAIGPKSQRPNGLKAVKTEPSRYLKLK